MSITLILNILIPTSEVKSNVLSSIFIFVSILLLKFAEIDVSLYIAGTLLLT